MKKRTKLFLGVVISIMTMTLAGCHRDTKGDCSNDLSNVEAKDISSHSNIQYRQKGQPKRKWNREIYYSDMDSVIVCRWDILTDKEKVNAIRVAFSFNLDESEWNKYSDSENLKMLLDNAFVEWRCK